MSMTKLRGWMGKLPCAGDFLSSGLPSVVAGQLDDWISLNLLWMNAHRPGWPELYFQSTARGFVIEDGVTLYKQQSERVLGILMPSVDAVGRPYPFILLQAMQGSLHSKRPTFEQQLTDLWTACANALELNWTVGKLENSLEDNERANDVKDYETNKELCNRATKGIDCIKSAWNEPRLKMGPESWFNLIPDSNHSLIIQPQPDLAGWPEGDAFLDLFSPIKEKA